MKYNKILVLFVLVVMLITACGPKPTVVATDVVPVATEPPIATEVVVPSEPVEIVTWNTWADHHVTAFQAIIDEFNATHPLIKVVQQQQPYADFEAKVMQAVGAGNGPDFLSTFPTVAANYIDEGLIVNLSDYIDDPVIGIPGFKDMLPAGSYQEITQWDGNVYLIPLSVGGEVLYYNKTLFDSLNLTVPTTWADLEANSRIITAATGKPAFGFDNEIDGFQVLIMQNGSGYIDPETMTVKYNNPIAVQQLTWFSDLVKEGVFRLVGEDYYFSNPFGSQAVASYLGSPAGIGFVKSAVADQFEFGVAPIPQGGSVEYVSSWGGGEIIFKTTEAKQLAAYEFIKYLMTPEILGGWCAAFGVVPAYEAAVNTSIFQEYLLSDPAISASAAQLDKVGFLSAVKGSAAIRTIIGRAVGTAAAGVVTPEEALQIAEAEGNAELAQNK